MTVAETIVETMAEPQAEIHADVQIKTYTETAAESQAASDATPASAESRLKQYGYNTATYSPDDNKLRLSCLYRLDPELKQRVSDAGFIWAGKQQVFVAPKWTPEREDLLLEICGSIEDDDQSLVERAEVRADRFEDYSDKRARESAAARRGVAAIADNIPLGQPILVGHHSERHARRDAERIHNGTRKSIDLWQTSQYWLSRAASARQHAKYKEQSEVRYRRIKRLKSDLSTYEKRCEDSRLSLTFWRGTELNPEQALHRLGLDRGTQYEVWSALNKGQVSLQDTAAQVIEAHERRLALSLRWVAHINNRLAYEQAMLEDQGGLVAAKVDVQVGGKVLIGNEWVYVLKVNKRNGAVTSVLTTGHFASARGVEEIKEYRPPSAEDSAKVKAAMKAPPMSNCPGEGHLHMTKAEWNDTHRDYKGTSTVPASEKHGAYRYRSVMSQGSLVPVYLTDAKRVDPPPAQAGG